MRQPDVKVWCFNVYNLFFFSFNSQATTTYYLLLDATSFLPRRAARMYSLFVNNFNDV